MIGNFFKAVGKFVWNKIQQIGWAGGFNLKNAFFVYTTAVGVKGFLQAKEMLAKGQDIMANKTAAGGKIPVIYGTRRVGAQIVYMDTAQNRSRDLFVVYAISVGECEEILGRTIEIDGNSILDGNIYKGGGYVGSDKISSGNGSLNTASQVGDNQYSSAGNLGTNPALRYSFVFNLHHGASSQTADPMLRASIPTEWTANHKLNGICYIAASFDYDKKGMYKGVPQITVQVKGKKVFDPRDSSTKWSSNPALCFLDYIQNDEYGKGLATSQINMTTISAAATACEVEVDQPYYNDTYQDLTWSGTAGNDFIVINDNDDWWQNKVDEVIDIRDSNDASIFSNAVSITGSTRYQYYDSVQENRLYIDDVLANSYTNEAGNARAKVKRFHCNGYIDTNKNVMDNAKELLANMRGIFLYIDGKYELQIEDTGTSTFSITDDHIIADAGISVDYGNKDKKANKVVIEFFNANKKYELDTATVLHDASPEYYSDDGEVLEVKAEFPYVTDPYIAYNMGKAILTRSRNQTTMQFLGTPEMYKLNVGDIVSLTYSGLGFSGKVCRVEALELQANGLVSVSLIEYFDVYTWEVPAQEPVEIIAHPPSIGALHPPEANSIVFTDTDASSINRPTLTWTEPTDFPVRQYRVDVVDSSANNVFSKIVDTPSVDLAFLPKAANYEASITSFNGVGIESNASTKTFTIADDPVKTTEVEMNGVTLSTVESYGTVTGQSGNWVKFTNQVAFIDNVDFEDPVVFNDSVQFENAPTFADGLSGQGLFNISAGSIQFGSYTPSTTTNNLYNVGGSLYWNGQALGTGTGDITAVVAGTNLNGGGTSGSVTLNLDSTITGNHTFSNNLIIGGDLTVQGTTTTVNTDDLNVKDKNITLNYSTGDSSASANGAGITIQDAVSVGNDATILWNTNFDNFDFSHTIRIPDSQKVEFGADADLQIYHESGNNHSVIKETGTGNLKIQAANIEMQIPNGTQNYLQAINGGAVTLYNNGSAKIATTSTGIDVTGTVTSDGIIHTGDTDTFIKFIDNRIYADRGGVRVLDFEANSSKINSFDSVFIQTGTTAKNRIKVTQGGDIAFYDDTGTSQNLKWDASADTLNFVDNAKAQFGAGNDLQIYHDGSNSIISDEGTGELRLRGSSYVKIMDTNNEVGLQFRTNGAVTLYHNNLPKFETTSTGIDVTGAVSATNTSAGVTTGLKLYNNTSGANNRVAIDFYTASTKYGTIEGGYGASSPEMNFKVGNAPAQILKLNSTGIDVTGTVVSDGLTVDGALATINSSGSNSDLILTEGTTNTDARIRNSNGILQIGADINNEFGASEMQFSVDGKEFLSIDRTGDISFYDDTGSTQGFFWDASAERLGLGTTSPSEKLTVVGETTSGSGTYGTKLTYSNGNQSGIIDTFGNHNLEFRANNDRAMNIANNGDISFYEDTGTTAKLFWDASAERLGIGETSLTHTLNVKGSVNEMALFKRSVAGNSEVKIDTTTSGDAKLTFASNGTSAYTMGRDNSDSSFRIASGGTIGVNDRLVINSSGSVGIGTTSPSEKLHVVGDVRFTGQLRMFDNQLIKMGDSEDFAIYHDTSVGNVIKSGTSDMDIVIQGNDGGSVITALTLDMSDAGKAIFNAGANFGSGIDVTGNITIPTGNKVAFDTDGLTYITEDQDERLRVWVHNTEFIRMTNTTTDELRLLPYGGNVFAGGNLDVTGTVTSDGLTVESGGTNIGIVTKSTDQFAFIGFEDNTSSTSSVYIGADGNDFIARANSITRFRAASNGDISFYNTAGNSQALFWDASAERLGLGTTSPTERLTVLGNQNITGKLAVGASAAHGSFDFYNQNTAYFNGAVTIDDNLYVTSGNVGIGTSSPDAALEVNSGGGIHLTDNTAGRTLIIKPSLTGAIHEFTSDNTAAGYAFSNSTSELMRIASNGKVGIGTSSPASKLHVNGNVQVGVGNSKEAFIQATNSGRVASNPAYSFNGDVDTGMFNPNTDNTIAFATGGSERARFDSSGLFLVGKTSGDFGTQGSNLVGGGHFVKDGNTALYLNRLSSDGSILAFYKDSSLKGSIGVSGDRIYFAGANEAVAIDDSWNAFIPVGTGGGNSSGDTDLGNPSSKFKDIWLSGTANVGAIASTELTVTNTTPTLKLIESDQSKEYQVGSYGAAFAVLDASANAFRYVIDTSGNHSFNSGNATFAGKIGIGTTSPSEKLHVLGNTKITGNITVGASHTIGDVSSVDDNFLIASADNKNLTIKAGVDSSTLRLKTTNTALTINPEGLVTIEEETTINDDLTINATTPSLNLIDTNNNSDYAVNNANGVFQIFDKTNDVSRLSVTSAGNVGIGTASPSSNLHIKTSVDNSLAQGLVIERSANTDKGYINYNGGGFQFRSTVGDPIVFGETDAEHLRINPDGNVGIGSTSPSHRLDVRTSASAPVAFFTSTGDQVPVSIISGHTSNLSTLGFKGLNSTTTYNVRVGAHTDDFVVLTSNSERLRVTSSGLVGIGTTSPSDKLTLDSGQMRLSDNYGIRWGAASTAIYGSGGAGTLQMFTNSSERFRIDSSGRVGIGTNSPDGNLEVVASSVIDSTSDTVNNVLIGLQSANRPTIVLDTADTTYTNRAWNITNVGAVGSLVIGRHGLDVLNLKNDGNVGIGTSSPSAKLEVNGYGKFTNSDNSPRLHLTGGRDYFLTSTSSGVFGLYDNTANAYRLTVDSSGDAEFSGNIEMASFLSLGNASVQGTFTSEGLFTTDSKAQIEGNKTSTTDAIATIKNKNTSNEGRYLQFNDNTGVDIGQIGHVDQTESNIFIATFSTGLKFESYITYKAILPCNENGADSDNAIDLGSSSVRFDDVYATNGTIQTSDRNEKQDIQALTDAEQRVATACKGLIRRFRWQDSVAEKDDNPDSDETARYHFGVIAQDLQDAFTAEGLDASDYGMFISSTWEDDDGVEQTRLGVRYNELLAFIITTI